MDNTSGITLKGSGANLRLTVRENLTEERFGTDAVRLITEASSILKGATTIIDLQGRSLDRSFFDRILRSLVWPSGMRVSSWVTFDVGTQQLLRSVGVTLGEPRVAVQEPRFCLPLVIERSLRSGQRIEHEGDVVIIGHVNDGAEIFSSGNVSVWGRLQGLVHAGFGGNDDVKIIVKQFETRQIRVGRCFGSIERDVAWWGRSALVAVEEGNLQVRNIDL